MVGITPLELHFIEDLGLLIEKAGGSRTLGRVFGYLLLADKPKTMDDIAADLLFSKATASLTIRQGLITRFFEKASIPGERKAYYRMNMQTWINAMSEKMNIVAEWDRLIESGLNAVSPENGAALENLKGMKDYIDFIHWYFSDFPQQYRRWKNGEIDKNIQKDKP